MTVTTQLAFRPPIETRVLGMDLDNRVTYRGFSGESLAILLSSLTSSFASNTGMVTLRHERDEC